MVTARAILSQPADGRVKYIDGIPPAFFASRPEGMGAYDGPDARMIKLAGDSVGYYEGNTLVVKTRNINPKQRFRGSSPDAVAAEYFTRVAENKIEYRFIIEDPEVFAEDLIGEIAMYRRPEGEPMYEYVCQEGDHALAGILAGVRIKERDDAAAGQ